MFKRNNGHNYIELFDLINREKQYDKEGLTIKIHTSIIKNPYVITHYLFDMVLNTLRSIHKKTAQESKVLGLLSEVEILYNKGLSTLCMKRIEKAYTLAKKTGNPYLLEAVSSFRIKYFFRIEDRFREETRLTELIQQRAHHHKVVNNIIDYYALTQNIDIHMQKVGSDREATLILYEKALKHPLFQDDKKALSNFSKIQFHYIHGLYYRILGDYDQHLHHTKKVLYYAMQSNYAKQDTLVMLNILGSYVNACTFVKKYDDAKKVIVQLRSMNVRYLPEEFAKFKALHISELDLLTMMSDKVGMQRKLQEIEKNLPPILKMNKQIGYIYMFKIAATYFYLHQYEKCIEWLNDLLDQLGSKDRKDVQIGCRLLFLIVQNEIGNTKLVEQYALSTKSYIIKHRNLFNFENELLKLFSKAHDIAYNDHHHWEKLLKVLEKDLLNISVKNDLSYFDYERWLKERIS